VALEYFMKWVEVKPVTNVSFATIKKLFWQNIIYCYGVPRHIIVDNVKYYDNALFKDFCQQVGTKVEFTYVYHPQSNDATERANTFIFKAIKKILEGKKKGKWVKVMQIAVWIHNTIVSRATNFTPFRLMYRAEVVLPEEVKH
jgi:hypothetical protein